MSFTLRFGGPEGAGDALISITPGRRKVHCRLHPEAKVTLFSGDLSVRVQVGDCIVHSAHDGFVSGTRTSDGTPFEARTAVLYLDAAEQQDIPVHVESGYGYYG